MIVGRVWLLRWLGHCYTHRPRHRAGWIGVVRHGIRHGGSAVDIGRIRRGIVAKSGPMDGIDQAIFWCIAAGSCNMADIACHFRSCAYAAVGSLIDHLGYLFARG